MPASYAYNNLMKTISNIQNQRSISELQQIFRHFLYRLRETPFLTGWLLVGLIITFFLHSWTGLLFGLINLTLIGLYAILIRIMTPNPAAPISIKHPRLELALAIGLLGLFLLTQLLDFGVWKIQPLQSWVRSFFGNLQLWIFGLEAIPDWARQDVFIAISSTIKKLIPTLVVFWLLGYRRGMGLIPPHWKITAVLVGIISIFGLFTGFLLRDPPVQILGLYLIGIFVNALPEELYFRAFLLPRLEKVLANPLNALVISALLFNALHIPIQIANGASPLTAMLGVFSTAYPSGLIWGYLYLRTRSIVPGMFWHAANGNLGFLMLSL